MYQLNPLALNQIHGGAIGDIEEFIPDSLPGYELIGWQQKVVDYDITLTVSKGWFWNSYSEVKTPIFEFTPIYA